MLAAQARLARDTGVPEENIVLAENGSVVELEGARGSSTTSTSARPSSTGSGSAMSGTSRSATDATSRRAASSSSTVGRRTAGRVAHRGDRPRLRGVRRRALGRGARRSRAEAHRLPGGQHLRAQAPPGARARRGRAARLRADAPPPNDLAGRRRGPRPRAMHRPRRASGVGRGIPSRRQRPGSSRRCLRCVRTAQTKSDSRPTRTVRHDSRLPPQSSTFVRLRSLVRRVRRTRIVRRGRVEPDDEVGAQEEVAQLVIVVPVDDPPVGRGRLGHSAS